MIARIVSVGGVRCIEMMAHGQTDGRMDEPTVSDRQIITQKPNVVNNSENTTTN